MRLLNGEPDRGQQALTFIVGAAGGLALGALISGWGSPREAERLGDRIRDRARGAAARLRPGRLRRLQGEQLELVQLEDDVLDAFLNDEVLRERGIDVGAISRGIIELSGSIRTDDEADHAVRIARRVPGVETVVNRMDVEDEARRLESARRRFEDGDPALTEARWEGRRSGMGRPRQGLQTEPDRRDDSRKLREVALDQADRDQWMSEDISYKKPRMAVRPEDRRSDEQETNFEHDDLDHQDPHRRHHAPNTLDEQPEERNTGARVGEPPKPGTELDLETTGMRKETDQD